MNTARAIRDGLARPTGVTYVMVFLLSALSVFVAVGHLSWIEASTPVVETPVVARYRDWSGGTTPASTRMNVAGDGMTAAVVVVDTQAGAIRPNRVAVRAGAATQILFRGIGGGAGSVSFPEVLTSERRTAQGIVVSLPPLPRGSYTFTCGDTAVSGVLIVE